MRVRSKRRARAPATDPPSRRRRRKDVQHVHGLPWEAEWRDWAELPGDILWSILSLIPQADILRVAGRTCALWRRLAVDEPLLWRHINLAADSDSDSEPSAGRLEMACAAARRRPLRVLPRHRRRQIPAPPRRLGAIAAAPPRDVPLRHARRELHVGGGEEAPSAEAARAVGRPARARLVGRSRRPLAAPPVAPRPRLSHHEANWQNAAKEAGEKDQASPAATQAQLVSSVAVALPRIGGISATRGGPRIEARSATPSCPLK
uniref:Predicted protein n=1 Tax=Hordeum vulgare subsp. vulgare TaxID=112509 RepID=F2EH10_HORVV|nr:predicted protein [Hordeum vulgare subsp. vulgare]